jgi:hypothetical protein
MSGQQSSGPRRGRKRLDKGDMPATFLPEGNRPARNAYLCAIFGMIPGIGLFLGTMAIVYGWLGYRAARGPSLGKGMGHSVVSMILGGLEVVANGVGWSLIATHYDWI